MNLQPTNIFLLILSVHWEIIVWSITNIGGLLRQWVVHSEMKTLLRTLKYIHTTQIRGHMARQNCLIFFEFRILIFDPFTNTLFDVVLVRIKMSHGILEVISNVKLRLTLGNVKRHRSFKNIIY